MRSLVVLMMEEEQPEGLSARKLIAETAKHNVLTAYSADNGLALLGRFPKVDAVLVHASLLEKKPDLVEKIREMEPEIPVILTTPLRFGKYAPVDFEVNSHTPQELLTLLNEKIKPRTDV